MLRENFCTFLFFREKHVTIQKKKKFRAFTFPRLVKLGFLVNNCDNCGTQNVTFFQFSLFFKCEIYFFVYDERTTKNETM